MFAGFSRCVRLMPGCMLLACAAPARGMDVGITNLAIQHGQPSIQWTQDTNHPCFLQRRSSMTTGGWESVCGLWPGASNAVLNDLWSPQDSPLFYRLAATNRAPSGSRLVTYVNVTGQGDLAIMLSTPERPRYDETSAAVVVHVNTFLTTAGGLTQTPPFADIGLIHLTYVWPGREDQVGVQSAGTYDYGGTNGIAGLRQVVRFAGGSVPDIHGRYLHELIDAQPLYDNIGLYAFSHPGIAAINVLCDYVGEMTNVAWFVGRENPTMDKLTAVEVGYFDGNVAVQNPLYVYPSSYAPTNLTIDYSTVNWSWQDDVPYFDMNNNGFPDIPGDHMLGPKCPSMHGERYYSDDMLNALVENGALTNDTSWPTGLARPGEAAARWPYRSSVQRYPELAPLSSSLAALLLFDEQDHVQPATDKPHIHQAYEGLRHGAGLWVRLNPDRAYMRWANRDLNATSPDNPANQEPANWLNVGDWAYQSSNATYPVYAAVAEMADRTYCANWTTDLDGTLTEAPSPSEAGDPLITTNGGEFVTYIYSEGVGNIAVKVVTPEQPRYGDRAGSVVIVTGFVGTPRSFADNPAFEDAGLLRVTFLWPGAESDDGDLSDGAYDYGGTNSMRVARDVLLFVCGEKTDAQGRNLHEYIEVDPLENNVGVYASSHAGIAAVNALALYAAELDRVAYYVGWENPTSGQLVSWDVGRHTATNALYTYPASYTSTNLVLDYGRVRWVTGFPGYPYFDVNSNETFEAWADYQLPASGSVMFDKRYYSAETLKALEDNEALPLADWPVDLATPTEAETAWTFRNTPSRYTDLAAGNPDLKVIITFGRTDHMQPPPDKPHIHQAWDGLRANGFWVRLNPDNAYALSAYPADPNAPDNDATNAPADWLDIGDWAYTNGGSYSEYANIAAAAELADRTLLTNWQANLNSVLVTYP